MYTKTGLSFLAAAGLAVGVAGMTMGGAGAASPTCVPSGTSDASNGAATAPARNASTANRSASTAPAGALGAVGPQGPSGTSGNGGGTGVGDGGSDPSGGDGTGVTGPTGATGSDGSNGLNGIRIVANTNPKADDVNGTASVTDNGGTLPTSHGARTSLLNVRARSNAVNPSGGTTGSPTSGTHVTVRSSLTGSQPIVNLTPGR